jgi:glycerophosphoryl diester phosphodiesterase
MPNRFAYLDHDGPIAFAHRGGASEVPENTMPAFQHAVNLGFGYVETDVHATSDGMLLAFHDSRLDRVTDSKGIISEMTWEQVRTAKVDGLEPIPLLADLLTAWPNLRINIDPKKDNAVEPLIAVLREHNAVERVCIGAFSDARLRRIRSALGPGLCTSTGPLETARLRFASWKIGKGPAGIGAAQVPVRQGPIPVVDRAFVSCGHRLGLAVHVWTIDDAAEMDRLLDLGVDGIMTDRPVILRDVFVRRGLTL